MRRETETLLKRAQAYVGELRLHVKPTAFGLTVDGILVELAASEPLLLEVGDHVLELRAAGHLSERRAVQIKGGQSQTLDLALSPADAQPERALTSTGPGSAPVRSELTPVYKRWWLWTTVGLVAAGAAVGAALVLTRDRKGA